MRKRVNKVVRNVKEGGPYGLENAQHEGLGNPESPIRGFPNFLEDPNLLKLRSLDSLNSIFPKRC